LFLVCNFSSSAGLAADRLTRISHSDVRHACMSDGSARRQHYWDVAIYDWGGVVPLNSWYHPQLMKLDPDTGVLEHVAIALPHAGQGNEDDPRERIVAHKGPDARSSYAIYSIYGYEEIEPENGRHRRDTAVIALRAQESSPNSGVLSRRTARVVNLDPAEAKNGLGRVSPRAGVAYDQRQRILFAPRDRTKVLANRELMQLFRFDPRTGRMLGRQSISLPADWQSQHLHTFIEADGQYGLVAIGSVTAWNAKCNRASIYLLQYAPATGSQIADVTPTAELSGLGFAGQEDEPSLCPEPTAAVFADDGEQLFLIVAGGDAYTKRGHDFSGGVYLFRLGPLGGPYRLRAPHAKIPFANGVRDLKRRGDTLYASSHGLHALDINEVLRLDGVSRQPVTSSYPLPYDTHGLDLATIDGCRVVALAAGRNGLDVFAESVDSRAVSKTAIAPREGMLRGKRATVLADATGPYRFIGKPVMAGEFTACWVATRRASEAIVRFDRSGESVVVADTALGPYVSLSRPSMNEAGDVAFWAGRTDGEQHVVVVADGKTIVANRGRANRHLYRPEIGLRAGVAFAGRPSGSHWERRIYYQTLDANAEIIFAENDEKRLGTGVTGDFAGDYDLARETVAFICHHGARDAHIYTWRNGRLRDLGAAGRYAQSVRLSLDARAVTFRRWQDEILSQCRWDLSDGVVVAAHRRASYFDPLINPGDFFGSRGDRRGNVVFCTVENSQSGRGRQLLGDQVWRYDAATGDLAIVAKPLDSFGQVTIINAGFRDGLGDGSVALTIDSRAADGRVEQLLLRIEQPAGD
jgi:hypothetical protein